MLRTIEKESPSPAPYLESSPPVAAAERLEVPMPPLTRSETKSTLESLQIATSKASDVMQVREEGCNL